MSTTLIPPVVVPSSPAARPAVRQSAPSFAALAVLEVRKSLSTRSGRAVAAGAAAVGPLGVVLATLTEGGGVSARSALGLMGMLVALVLFALGVLSTAGEWSSRSVQTTFLLVPRRGRVLAAKVAAMTALGGALAAAGVAGAAGALAVLTDGVTWDGAAVSAAVVVAAGAAFAVIGAGIGAAVGVPAAAMTGTYLVVLGVMPVLTSVRPEIAEKLDPASAVVTLAGDPASTTAVLVLAGWMVLATLAGAVVTRRRAVA